MENNLTKIHVTIGTDYVNEVDDTLNFLLRQSLVLSFKKDNSVDSIKYTIEFKDAEGAYLFGRSRPQIKLT